MWERLSHSLTQTIAMSLFFVVAMIVRYATYWSADPVDPTRVNILGVAPPQSSSPALLQRDTEQTLWQVAYVTQQVDEHGDSSLEFGTAQVNLPSLRGRGSMELAQPGQPETSFTVKIEEQSHVPKETLYQQLKEQLANSEQKDLLIFVHGFNVSFEEAVCRTAQMAEDMPFSGTVLTFDWRSAGHELGYFNDLITTGSTHVSLSGVLAELRAELGKDVNIHILAHSMGNRFTLNALQTLATYQPIIGMPKEISQGSLQDHPLIRPRFADWQRWHPQFGEPAPVKNLIFAAPDVDPKTFASQVQTIGRVVEHMTLYCNEADMALDLSRYVNGQGKHGFRIGDARSQEPGGVDVIRLRQVSRRDPFGHSYYGSHVGMLTDLSLLLKGETKPLSRPTVTAGNWPNSEQLFLR